MRNDGGIGRWSDEERWSDGAMHGDIERRVDVRGVDIMKILMIWCLRQ